MRFDYTRYDSSRVRPLLDVAVRFDDREASYVLLVDSGADISVFSAEVAREIGIDLESGDELEVRGATGTVTTFWRHTVDVLVGDRYVGLEAAFGDADNLEAVGLAGQEGFFDSFRVSFDRAAGYFELQPSGTR